MMSNVPVIKPEWIPAAYNIIAKENKSKEDKTEVKLIGGVHITPVAGWSLSKHKLKPFQIFKKRYAGRKKRYAGRNR